MADGDKPLTKANTSVIIDSMTTERDSALTSRAAKHAALADPARLMIVDALTLGDASPSELQLELGMASNLVAHHVKVLEAEGIVRRRRSQGDRRRTYVSLVRESLHGLVPGGNVPVASRVVFVCTANSARSQLAAALWTRASRVPAISAGTHPAARIAPGAVAVARRRGLPLRARRPRGLGALPASDDVVVTVCDQAREELVDDRPIHWSVPDPVAVGTDAAFDTAFDELDARVEALAPLLSPPTPRSQS